MITKLTSQLQRNMWQFNPDDKVLISNKLHGTSIVIGNVLIKKPVQLSIVQKLFNRMTEKKIKRLKKNYEHIRYHKKDAVDRQITKLKQMQKPSFNIGYGNVYSSRTVIKNQYINPNVNSGFYKVDVWGTYNDIMKPYIEKGMMIYGEICGYVDKTGKMIQKGYDYGCEPGENFLMIYRIVTTRENGTKKEWEVDEIHKWTVNLIKKHPELKKNLHPIDILYNGTLKDLYPEISTTEHWHENVLEALRNDKEHFGMEELEPMCKNKTPREGIVLRKYGDPVAEAFKLKCIAFLEKERAEYDKGEVDIEATEGYAEENAS